MSSDTATLIHRSARLAVDDIDFDAFADRPLDAETLRCSKTSIGSSWPSPADSRKGVSRGPPVHTGVTPGA